MKAGKRKPPKRLFKWLKSLCRWEKQPLCPTDEASYDIQWKRQNHKTLQWHKQRPSQISDLERRANILRTQWENKGESTMSRGWWEWREKRHRVEFKRAALQTLSWCKNLDTAMRSGEENGEREGGWVGGPGGVNEQSQEKDESWETFISKTNGRQNRKTRKTNGKKWGGSRCPLWFLWSH